MNLGLSGKFFMIWVISLRRKKISILFGIIVLSLAGSILQGVSKGKRVYMIWAGGHEVELSHSHCIWSSWNLDHGLMHKYQHTPLGWLEVELIILWKHFGIKMFTKRPASQIFIHCVDFSQCLIHRKLSMKYLLSDWQIHLMSEV